ncbi:ABC-2 transporter permease [Thomasclavelia cocleata]|uniref:ABC-2 transporter permease n=1 Tax=Thomasclavelia cocleata TaxID=69824 RepID=UPI00272DD028|nr:ABC-2 transporter permease [Thomasclavelia cocleata]
MFGLIKKDFLLIKANLRSMMIVFIVYLILAFQGTLDVTFIVPLIGIMLFISTFSYDDFNNWNSYAVTLPNGRKNVVRAKYIASIILTVILGIGALAIGIGISYTKTNSINLDEIISSLMGTMLSSVIIITLLYPIVFKFGATNGRIILFAVVFGIAGIGAFIAQFVDMTFIINMINRLDSYALVAIPIISVILLGISYLISNKIYQSKEF